MAAKAIFYEHPVLKRNWFQFCVLNCRSCWFTGCAGEKDKNSVFDLDIETRILTPYKRKRSKRK